MTPLDTSTPFIAIADSRIGGRFENQDTCAWKDTKHGMLVLVCDGMGGGPSGKMASQIAADAIVNYVLDSKLSSDRSDVLRMAIRHANEKLLEAQSADPRLRGMGTTVTALLINEQSAIVAHVGDSRVYQLRGTGKVFRTFDHSHVFELVKAKVMTEEKARTSGESNIITRALGPMEKAEPDIVELPYERGDRFMLCTDGIWGAMPEKELIQIAGGTKSLAGAVDSLVIKVDEIGRANGGSHDNLTVAILQTPFNSKLKQHMSTRIKYTLYGLIALCCVSLLGNFVQYKLHGGAPADNAKELAGKEGNDVVTRAELNRLLEQERERNDAEINKYRERIKEQDDNYARRLEQFSKFIIEEHRAADSEEIDEQSKELIADAANMEIIKEINSLIQQVEAIKQINKRGDNLDKSLKQARTDMGKLVAKVKKMDLHNSDFEKCVNENWISNSITRDCVNKKRPGHFTSIIKALESLREQIRNTSK